MIRSTLSFIVFVILFLSCKEDPEPVVTYPATGQYGDNILFQGKTEYNQSQNSLQANVPAGLSVYIRITGTTASGGHGAPLMGVWAYDPGSVNNWAIASFDLVDYTQTFTSIDGGQTCDVKMMFDEGSFLIEYFEHDLSTPNFSKTITVNY